MAGENRAGYQEQLPVDATLAPDLAHQYEQLELTAATAASHIIDGSAVNGDMQPGPVNNPSADWVEIGSELGYRGPALLKFVRENRDPELPYVYYETEPHPDDHPTAERVHHLAHRRAQRRKR